VLVEPTGTNVTSFSSCKPNFGSSSFIQPYSKLPTVDPPSRFPRSSATLLIPGCANSIPGGLSLNTIKILSFAPWTAAVGLLAEPSSTLLPIKARVLVSPAIRIISTSIPSSA
jgi:hypothetical protein